MDLNLVPEENSGSEQKKSTFSQVIVLIYSGEIFHETLGHYSSL
jgi:hypothetical protein